LQTFAKGFAIVFGLIATALAVNAGGAADVLEIGALPGAALLIVFYRLLGPRAEHSAWATFMVFLGVTYLSPEVGGSFPMELGAFVVLTGLAAAGWFVSPWFIALGFALHIPWDFLPRELPDFIRGLPVACLLFDGLVAVYIGWQARSGRWRARGA
jgi:hypothetical protein